VNNSMVLSSYLRGKTWLLIDQSPLLVSLVQTASGLPIVLLALPVGAWADLVDRRRLLLGAQGAMFLAASALAVTTFVGAASPALVLVLTFALGCGNATTEYESFQLATR
jgi:MFS family permease